MLFRKLKLGFKIGYDGFKFLFKYPKSLVSILIFWIVFLVLGSTLYGLVFLGDTVDSLMGTSLFLSIFIIVTMVSVSISISSLFLLEMMKQIETTGNIKLFKALKEVIMKDLLRTLPLIIIWSALSLFIRIIQFITTFFISAIKIVLRIPLDDFSGTGSSIFNIIVRGIRLFMAFCLPAIAWEKLNTFRAFTRAWKVIKNTWVNILGAIVFSNLIFASLLIPFILLYYFSDNGFISEDLFAILFLVVIIAFYGISLLIQQIYVGQLYLWFMKWEKEVQSAIENDTFQPDLEDVPLPSFFDDIRDLQ